MDKCHGRAVSDIVNKLLVCELTIAFTLHIAQSVALLDPPKCVFRSKLSGSK